MRQQGRRSPKTHKVGTNGVVPETYGFGCCVVGVDLASLSVLDPRVEAPYMDVKLWW